MMKLLMQNDAWQRPGGLSGMPGVVRVDCQVADSGELRGAALLDRLEQACSRIEGGASCRLIVFDGLGLARVDAAAGPPDLCLYGRREQLLKRLRGLDALSVALVDGICAGAHFEIALGADACLASGDSAFALPELAQGYLPGLSAFRLVRHIGLHRARRLMLVDGAMGARDALALGLLDTVCPVKEFPRELALMLARAAQNSPVAVASARRLLEASADTRHEDSLGHFLAAQHYCYDKLDLPFRKR